MAGENVINIILHAEDKASGPMKSALGGLQSFGKLAAGAVVGATAAIAGLTAGAVALAAQAEPLVGLTQGFETLTASIEGGSQAMLSALREASGGLITNRELMTSYNTATALVSEDFANTLPEAMSLVQRASQATGQSMGFMLESLVRGVGRVSPLILDNLGIQVALSEVTEHAAEMFGKQADELTKTEQQAALNEIVMRKLNEVYGDIPPVDSVIARFRTTLANLKDDIGLALLPAVSTLMGSFANLADDLLPKLVGFIKGSVAPALQTMGEVVGSLVNYFKFTVESGDALNDWLTHLPEPIQEIVYRVGQFVATLRDGQGVFAAFVEAIDDNMPDQFVNLLWTVHDLIVGIVDPIINAITQFISWKDVMIGIGIAIASFVLPVLWGIVTAIVSAAAPIFAVIAAVALLRAAWENDWLGIRTIVQTVIDWLVPKVTEAIKKVREWWAEHGDEILAKAEETWEAVKEAVRLAVEKVQEIAQRVISAVQEWWAEHGDEILEKAKEIWEGVKEAVRTGIETAQEIIEEVTGFIGELWENHGASILESAGRIWAATKGAIEEEIGRIQGIVESVWGAVSGFWEEHNELIKQTASDVWEAIKGFIEDAFEVIDEVFQTFAELFEGNWENFGEQIVETWEAYWQMVTDFLGNLWEAFEPLLGELWEDIKGWFTETDWGELGKKIIDGIIEGLVNAASALYNVIRGIIQGSKSSADEEAIAESPAQLFVPLGKALIDGIIKGLEEEEGVLLDALGRTIRRIRATLDVVGQFGGLGGAFLSVYQARVLGPVQKQIDSLEEQMLALRPERLAEMLGMEVRHLQRITPDMLEGMAKMGYPITDQVRRYVELMWERNEAQEEYATLMERVTKMQEAQMNLQFLMAQLDLITMIREAGLDVGEILGGIQLGLDADIPTLVDALSEAIAQLIKKASGDLKKAQYGASWLVGGHGGPDSQLIQFMASPGERITILPPGRAGGAGPQTVNQYYLTAHYRYQAERDVRDDLETLAMLYGGS